MGLPLHLNTVSIISIKMPGSQTSSEPSSIHNSNTQAKPISPADRLARKRILDRKAQQAARLRTKWTIENLQYQVAQLNNTLVSETLRYQALLQDSHNETERIRAENQALQLQLHDALSRDCEASPGEMCLLESADSASGPSSVSAPIVQPFESIPWNTEPMCVSDRIVQGYVATARTRVHATSDIFLKEQPDLSALLAHERSSDNPGVSNVVSDILLAYSEINTLPKKAACLYVMYKLLNWLIYRTKTTYDQMPSWLRPVPLQLQVQHPAWIDRIPWPNARIYLIQNPSISFDDFASCYSTSFDLSWPYDHSHVLISWPQNLKSTPEAAFNDWFMPYHECEADGSAMTGDAILNPVFEQHLRQLRNWTVSDSFRRQFNELSAIIDSDMGQHIEGHGDRVGFA